MYSVRSVSGPGQGHKALLRLIQDVLGCLATALPFTRINLIPAYFKNCSKTISTSASLFLLSLHDVCSIKDNRSVLRLCNG